MKELQQLWIERKTTLKQEICNYFFNAGADRETVKKACQSIKWHGEVLIEIGIYNKDGWEPILPKDIDDFRPQHRMVVAAFINRYAVLHKEALNYLESQRNYGKKTNWARDDFEHEDWESTQPNGEVQVHPDCIKVFAFGYKEGFAASLPRQGKKSVGKTTDGGYEWHYPHAALESLKKLGLPVLYAIDFID